MAYIELRMAAITPVYFNTIHIQMAVGAVAMHCVACHKGAVALVGYTNVEIALIRNYNSVYFIIAETFCCLIVNIFRGLVYFSPYTI